jgi:hypothetical protein
MANVAGQGTIWNLPNYAGELFTADAINTPFLNMIGGISGGKQTDNFEFPIASTYAMPAAAQPAITETASLTAPAAVGYVRDQITNVAQIYQEKVSISYSKMSNGGRMSGLNTAGQEDNVPSEKDFQIARALEKIARDVEYTCLNGVYQLSTSAAVANKSRGLIPLCATGNTVAGAAAQLTKAMMQSLLKTMFTNGAVFKDMVIWVNAFQKQMLSSLYGYAPTDRLVGGVNIKQIETDFGTLGIMLNRFMPADTVLVADMAGVEPVFQPVPEKGNFFYETLAKTGASEDGQIYGQFGLDHGVVTLHGTITGLAIV